MAFRYKGKKYTLKDKPKKVILSIIFIAFAILFIMLLIKVNNQSKEAYNNCIKRTNGANYCSDLLFK